MSPPPESTELDPLTRAAGELAGELRTFEQLSESLRKEPLTSQKSLERAARVLGEAADADERVGKVARQLVEVIGQVGGRQRAFAELITQRAHEIQARTHAFQALLQRYEQLGQVAAQTNQAVQQAMDTAQSHDVSELKGALPSLLESMDQAASAAQELVEAARGEQFDDLARNADSLRQQLLSARNKMNLLHQKLANPGALLS